MTKVGKQNFYRNSLLHTNNNLTGLFIFIFEHGRLIVEVCIMNFLFCLDYIK